MLSVRHVEKPLVLCLLTSLVDLFGKRLEDRHTLSEYNMSGLKQGDIVQMTSFAKPVHTLDGYAIVLDVDASKGVKIGAWEGGQEWPAADIRCQWRKADTVHLADPQPEEELKAEIARQDKANAGDAAAKKAEAEKCKKEAVADAKEKRDREVGKASLSGTFWLATGTLGEYDDDHPMPRNSEDVAYCGASRAEAEKKIDAEVKRRDAQLGGRGGYQCGTAGLQFMEFHVRDGHVANIDAAVAAKIRQGLSAM